MLTNTLPKILACTSLNSSFINAIMLTINSIAFPNVAFNNPPIAGPTVAANSSVANESNAAKGMIARKFKQKIAIAGQSRTPAMRPTGTKTKRTLM